MEFIGEINKLYFNTVYTVRSMFRLLSRLAGKGGGFLAFLPGLLLQLVLIDNQYCWSIVAKIMFAGPVARSSSATTART